MGWTRDYVDSMPYRQFVEHEAWLNVEQDPVAAGGYTDDVAGQIAEDRDIYYRDQKRGRANGEVVHGADNGRGAAVAETGP